MLLHELDWKQTGQEEHATINLGFGVLSIWRSDNQSRYSIYVWGLHHIQANSAIPLLHAGGTPASRAYQNLCPLMAQALLFELIQEGNEDADVQGS